MFHFHQDASFDQFMNYSQIFDPQVCISCSWLDTLFFSFFVTHQLFPLLSTWTLMGPLTSLRRHKKAVSSSLLMVRALDLIVLPPSSHTSRATAPPHRDPTAPLPTRSPFPSGTQQRAVSRHMTPETFDLRTPTLVLFGFPNLHSEVSSVPLAVTERGCAAMLLCHFHSFL